MEKRPFIIANWKMNLDSHAVDRFFGHFEVPADKMEKVQIVTCPSFVFVERVKKLIGDRPMTVGGQNISAETHGAFTGEVSAEQLHTAGADYVIVGHSERRNYFHETDELVNRKIHLALHYGMSPILCIGESSQEKEEGLTKKVVERQLTACLQDVRSHDARRVIITYEPVWAISTSPDNPGGADNPESAQVIHRYIRTLIAGLYDQHTAETVPVIYGGSVNPENADGFAAMDDIDGGLVGAASKDPASFLKVIKSFAK